MITVEQCRAARALLDWTQKDLAMACGLSKTAINNFEKENSDMKAESLKAIRMAFESFDIEFMEDGLKRKKDRSYIYKGPEATSNLIDDIYMHVRNSNEEILMMNASLEQAREQDIKKWRNLIAPQQTISPQIRILLAHTDSQPEILGNNTTYKFLTKPLSETLPTTCLFGSKIAIKPWENTQLYIVAECSQAVQAEKQRFNMIWDNQSTDTLKENLTNSTMETIKKSSTY